MLDNKRIRYAKDMDIYWIIRNDEKREYTGITKGKDGHFYGLHFVRVNPDMIIEHYTDEIPNQKDSSTRYLYIKSYKRITDKEYAQYLLFFDKYEGMKFDIYNDFFFLEIVMGCDFSLYVNS